MNREEIKGIVERNLHTLYGIDGEVHITIDELNTIDGILMEVYKRSISNNKQKRVLSEDHKQKISASLKGKPLSEATKERIRKNSQRINVYQYTTDGELVCVWKSTRDAERNGGFSNSAISKCCRGKRKTAGGYVWKYKPLGEEDVNITIHIEKTYQNEHPERTFMIKKRKCPIGNK